MLLCFQEVLVPPIEVAHLVIMGNQITVGRPASEDDSFPHLRSSHPGESGQQQKFIHPPIIANRVHTIHRVDVGREILLPIPAKSDRPDRLLNSDICHSTVAELMCTLDSFHWAAIAF